MVGDSKKLDELFDMVSFIKDHMATKDDVHEIIREEMSSLDAKFTTAFAELNGAMKEGFAAIHTDIREIKNELVDIGDRLDNIESHIAVMKGYSVEIDELRSRLKAIEKHLGIHAKIVA